MGGGCAYDGMDWGVVINLDNRSSREFRVRFNTGGFHAVDDIGTQYKLYKVGLPNFVDVIGLDMNFVVNAYQNKICLDFQGSFPLRAKYLLITADYISGVGPITFKKDL